MREGVLLSLLAVLALLLQTTVLPRAAIGRATPDLMLIICVYLGLHHHTVGGAVGAFMLGYLQDAFSGSVIGLNAFGMCLVFSAVYLTSRRLWVDNTLSQIVVVFLASMLKTVTVLILVAIFLPVDGWWHSLLGSLFLQAGLAAIISPPLFALLAQTQGLAVEEEE